MSDRIADIRARLDKWHDRAPLASIGDALDRAAAFTEDAAHDLHYLLTELDAARERAESLRAEIARIEARR